MNMLVAFVCGLIFGAGLLISGMLQTTKVLGFLDIFGAWDPSLAVVMAAALAVAGTGFAVARRHDAPLVASRHVWPTERSIDRPLAAGAAIFGIGWGLVGLCPGPALENLATLSPRVIVFVIAMAVGIVVQNLWQKSRRSTGFATPPAAAMTDG